MKRLLPSFLLASTLVLFACAPKAEEEPAEAPAEVTVEAAPALSAPIQQKIVAEAVIYPIAQAAVAAKITAPIRAFHVNRGAAVRAGQLLAELESADLAGAVTENQASLDQAEAAFQTTSRAAVPQEEQKAEIEVRGAKDLLAVQQKRYDSLQDLYKQGAIAQKDVNDALVALTQTRNQLEISQRVLQDLQGFAREQAVKGATAQRDIARAHLATSQTQLSYARIVSPIDGVVTDRPLFAGETAAAGTPLITIMDLTSVIARAQIPPQEAAFLKVGNAATLFPLEGGTLNGTITQIGAALSPSNTTVEVWIQAANPGGKLKAGSSLKVQIVAKSEPNALVVPESSIITEESGETFVIKIGEGDKPEKVAVMLGIHDAGNVQILEGLKGGDRVVSTGAYGLSKLEKDDLAKTKLNIQLPKEEDDDDEE